MDTSVIPWFPSDIGYGIHSFTSFALEGAASRTVTVTTPLYSFAEEARGIRRTRRRKPSATIRGPERKLRDRMNDRLFDDIGSDLLC